MTREEVIQKVKALPEGKLEALDGYIEQLTGGGKGSSRGIGAKYANKALIESEGQVASMAFSGV